MDFSFVKLLITIRLAGNVPDPLALFGIRSRFHAAYRLASGCLEDQCIGCSDAAQCSYSLAFGQFLSPDPSALKRFQKPPLPFIFDIPLLPPLPNSGSLCEIGLTLVGAEAIRCSAYLAAVRSMFDQGNTYDFVLADILQIDSVGYHKERHPVLETEGAVSGLAVLSMEGLHVARGLHDATVRLEFVTPLRIVQKGKPLHDLSPATFLMSLVRRISSLAFYYEGVEFLADYRWLAEQSSRLKWERSDFQWNEWSRFLSGITGSAVLTGNLTEFQPFLLLGEYLHLGKSSSFGLGQYVIGTDGS